MAPQSPVHPWRRPLSRGLGARSSVTGSVFPTDMGYIGASGFASEKYFQRTEPAPERRAMFRGVAGPCSAEREPLVTAMATITAPLLSRAAAADLSLKAPAPGHRDRTIKSPASYPTRAMERQSSEVWCQPAEGVERHASFEFVETVNKN